LATGNPFLLQQLQFRFLATVVGLALILEIAHKLKYKADNSSVILVSSCLLLKLYNQHSYKHQQLNGKEKPGLSFRSFFITKK